MFFGIIRFPVRVICLLKLFRNRLRVLRSRHRRRSLPHRTGALGNVHRTKVCPRKIRWLDDPASHLDAAVFQTLRYGERFVGSGFVDMGMNNSDKTIHFVLARSGSEMPMVRILLEVSFVVGAQPIGGRSEKLAGGVCLQFITAQ